MNLFYKSLNPNACTKIEGLGPVPVDGHQEASDFNGL